MLAGHTWQKGRWDKRGRGFDLKRIYIYIFFGGKNTAATNYLKAINRTDHGHCQDTHNLWANVFFFFNLKKTFSLAGENK